MQNLLFDLDSTLFVWVFYTVVKFNFKKDLFTDAIAVNSKYF